MTRAPPTSFFQEYAQKAIFPSARRQPCSSADAENAINKEKNMKKIFIRLVASALLCLLTLCPLSSCGKAEDSGDIDITCTVFPIYDWVRSIVGDTEGVNVRLLVKNGTDVHSFQPSFEDMATVKGSEAVVYIGGASDGWIGDSASEGAEKLSISELEGIRLYSASDTTDSHTHHEGEEYSHTETFDEHLWLSISNAKVTCKEIYGLLCRLDGDNKEAYESNLSDYMSKLDSLESAMAAIGEKADKPLVFADRFPFVYLFSDHGIECYGIFIGKTNAKAEAPIVWPPDVKS